MRDFDYGGIGQTGRVTGQSMLRLVSGLECMMREILKGVANLAVDVSEDTGVSADCEEWTEQKPVR